MSYDMPFLKFETMYASENFVLFPMQVTSQSRGMCRDSASKEVFAFSHTPFFVMQPVPTQIVKILSPSTEIYDQFEIEQILWSSDN